MTGFGKSFWLHVLHPPTWVKLLLFLGCMICYGAAGFLYFEIGGKPELGWSDAFWWTFVTMTTVGFGDYFPVTTGGRILVGIPIMLTGAGMLGYALTQVSVFFIRAEALNRKGFRMVNFVDHILLCNHPSKLRVLHVVQELRKQPVLQQVPIVLVDEKLEEIDPQLTRLGVSFVKGHPARRETLERANISKARRAVVLANSPTRAESDDLAVVACLTLRELRPDLYIVVECVEQDNAEILTRAGANSIVCVMNLTPTMLAQEVQEPGLVDVFQQLTSWSETYNNIHIVPLKMVSNAGKTIRDLRTLSVNAPWCLLGIRRDASIDLNPEPSRVLNSGDAAIVLSTTRPTHIEI